MESFIRNLLQEEKKTLNIHFKSLRHFPLSSRNAEEQIVTPSGGGPEQRLLIEACSWKSEMPGKAVCLSESRQGSQIRDVICAQRYCR